MTIKTRITTAIATGAVLLNALAPITFADEITVTGNGAFSDSTVKVESDNKTVVDQNNYADVTNKVTSNANTGGNTGSFNTGGDTKIVTGDAVSKTDVSTAVNLNVADVENCADCDNNLDVKVSGNGAYSDNYVKVDDQNKVKVSQTNDADINNYINAKADTGKNDASFNTGGDAIIVTGDARTKVDVENNANANFAKISGGSGDSHGSSVVINGNGAFSDNKAKINLESATIIDQYNDADIDNHIYAKANTGKNDASFNTGGETAILTGDAVTKVDVDNNVNFNAASLDCDCVLGDLKIKISGNGAESYNKVLADIDNIQKVYQDNYADIYNHIDSKSTTGKNDVSFFTGETYSDPLIVTGDAWSTTNVDNKGNVNLLNDGFDLHLPGNWVLNAHFDLSDLLSQIHLG